MTADVDVDIDAAVGSGEGLNITAEKRYLWTRIAGLARSRSPKRAMRSAGVPDALRERLPEKEDVDVYLGCTSTSSSSPPLQNNNQPTKRYKNVWGSVNFCRGTWRRPPSTVVGAAPCSVVGGVGS